MNIGLALLQLKAFARQDGAILALVWMASFLLLAYAPQTPLANLLMIATPAVVVWRLIRFRDGALGGVISFRRALAYSCYVFFYASLLFAVAQYLYFRFVDSGFLQRLLADAAKTLGPVYAQQGMGEAELIVAVETIGMLSPFQLAFMFMMQNLFIGFFLSLIISAVGMRRKPK